MINSFYDNGADPSVIVRDLISSVHDISMVKISADQGVKNSLTEAEYKEVKEWQANDPTRLGKSCFISTR